MIAGSDITYEHFYETMLNFWRQGKKGDMEAARLFNLKLGKWHSEDEFLYPETFGGLAMPNTDNSPDWVVDNLDEICELFGE